MRLNNSFLVRSCVAAAVSLVSMVSPSPAQGRGRGNAAQDSLRAQRFAMEAQLESLAVVERKVMVPMRDGKRMQFDIYRPKNVAKAPAIFVRTPYQMNFWDIQLGAPASMQAQLDAVKRGYAYVGANERGHFFSEGNYDILGPPLTDGVDEIQYISSRPWSNGKVGLIGCSSTAEWQMAVAAQAPKGLGTIIPQGFGAGVGRVKPYYEQGNWYRGGAVQMLFIDWVMGEQNQVRPLPPKNATQEELVRFAKSFDLAAHAPPVDWATNFWHLPEMDLIKNVDGPHGIFADSMPVATGGAMIKRAPNDPAWYRGGLFHDNMVINVPGLWYMSWYDVSVGPNLATYNHVRKTAKPEIGNQQYAIIAPTLHCSYTRATEHTILAATPDDMREARDVGDARYAYAELQWAWFDRFLKGVDNHLLDTMPKVRYYTMGLNKWQSSDTWPPKGAQPMTFYFGSDGKLTLTAPSADHPDGFEYDPMKPVPSHGGNVCCQANALGGGALDQRKMEERPDILVYTTDPVRQPTEVSGPISVTLYVSSDRKDTDFTVKLIDVYPDGRAYNLDETIQRARYRNGYDKPVAWMEPGKVYKIELQPMTTSNYFDTGHRLRIEVSSSNFPRFDRNMNTGGKNYDETTGLVAHNQIHHSAQYPSSVTVTVVRRAPAADSRSNNRR